MKWTTRRLCKRCLNRGISQTWPSACNIRIVAHAHTRTGERAPTFSLIMRLRRVRARAYSSSAGDDRLPHRAPPTTRPFVRLVCVYTSFYYTLLFSLFFHPILSVSLGLLLQPPYVIIILYTMSSKPYVLNAVCGKKKNCTHIKSNNNNEIKLFNAIVVRTHAQTDLDKK